MTPSAIFISIILPIVLAFIATWVSRRLLPYDIDEKKSTTIKSLLESIEILREQNNEMDKQIRIMEVQNDELRQQVDHLDRRDKLVVVAELHVQLSNPPSAVVKRLEYLEIAQD